MIRFISAKVFGISILQEYVCVGLEDFRRPLTAYITGTDPSRHFLVSQEILLGYKPLIIGISCDTYSEQTHWLQHQERVCISFVMKEFVCDMKWNGLATDKKAVARLILRRVKARELGTTALFIFEGERGKHRFLTPFHQATNRVKQRFLANKTDNWLPGNLYDQVRIGYAKPRIIALITVYDQTGLMNMFPTDLHGQVGRNYYAGSLRLGGRATLQIEQSKVIALSQVRDDWYREAYSLGKNHMKDFQAPDNFFLSPFYSRESGIPLPGSVVCYRELKRIDSLDLGIHRIHFYETLYEERLSKANSLAHIHCYYAQFRRDQKLLTDYLIR